MEKNQEDMKRITLANAYGAAFPVQMGIERQMLSRYVFLTDLTLC